MCPYKDASSSSSPFFPLRIEGRESRCSLRYREREKGLLDQRKILLHVGRIQGQCPISDLILNYEMYTFLLKVSRSQLGAAKEIPEFIQINLNDFSQIGLNEWL